MAHALRNAHRTGRARHRVHELRVDGGPLRLADQRMVREDVQRDRKLAGDDAIDEGARAARTEIDDLLRGELTEKRDGPFFAACEADGRDEQRRAAGGPDAPGKLAPPARIEQVVVA